ncbi:protein of unknown function DUF900 hydrolase family protein [Chloroherpeton thalassium ATCC 35110]|uniref:Uncharacterized protein n=1 Tax=Chloroherpeton thalassium (strain ATCC 35110 / GB-78) TaxID=517418 RepID=B3QYI1_CHLT3|nr:alpha/beta hydrolase [Chloroherpeton thalassium]ACF13609.1 protein of unknown function DUF900 hydrolase family protein [Chloroherpeton thalassium ATCC 35110]
METIHWGFLQGFDQWQDVFQQLHIEAKRLLKEKDMEKLDLLWKQIEEFLMQCPSDFQDLIEQAEQLAEQLLAMLSHAENPDEMLESEAFEEPGELEADFPPFSESKGMDLLGFSADRFFGGAASAEGFLGTDEKVAYHIMQVFHATDRKPTGKSKPGDFYGYERGKLHYGMCEVSIPKNHQTGELESPSVLRLEFRDNPEKHVALLKITEQEKGIFFQTLSDRLNQSEKKAAFIFVHGYNVSFEDAARRTAQMAFDLQFKGAPIFYSWPSHAKLLKYTADENNVEWSQGNFEAFMKDFCEKTDAENIYLIAHSMGNRCLAKGIKELVETDPAVRARFREIILTAPDIDADVFKEQIAPVIAMPNFPVTLYASSKDKALRLSKLLHGGYPRAGESGEQLVLADGIETIDSTNVDTSLLGHGYFSDNRSVLSDIYYLLKDLRPDKRYLSQIHHPPKQKYWEFQR